MSKSVREIEIKFYLCYLDALLDKNYSLEYLDIEDNVIPERNKSKVFSGDFRLKSFPRNDNTIEKLYLRVTE